MPANLYPRLSAFHRLPSRRRVPIHVFKANKYRFDIMVFCITDDRTVGGVVNGAMPFAHKL